MSKSELYKITRRNKLLRRIPRKPSHIKNGRVTSACFKTSTGEDGLSVHILAFVTDIGAEYNLTTHSAIKFGARIPLDEGYDCIHDPQKESYAHAIIEGDTTRIARVLANNCEALFADTLPRFSG